MERTLHLAVGTFHTALADRIVFSLNLYDVAVLVLCATGALHDVGILKTHLFAHCHSEELLGSLFHKVLALNPEVL